MYTIYSEISVDIAYNSCQVFISITEMLRLVERQVIAHNTGLGAGMLTTLACDILPFGFGLGCGSHVLARNVLGNFSLVLLLAWVVLIWACLATADQDCYWPVRSSAGNQGFEFFFIIIHLKGICNNTHMLLT